MPSCLDACPPLHGCLPARVRGPAASGQEFSDSEPATSVRLRQVYREMDSEGRVIRDVIAWYDDEDARHESAGERVDGMPLLVPILKHGVQIGRFTLDAEEWEAAQRSAMGESLIDVVDRTRE